MTKIKLKPRLSAAAAFARPGKRFADIGTDHAYLPIFLVSEGISPVGVASDINRGPVDRAKKNIRQAGLDGRIGVNLGDGLQGIDNYAPEDIFILGMGGELIAKILEAAPFVKNPALRLILQPMTHHSDTRDWLLKNGFRIDGEALVKEDGRIYQLISAEYDGKVRERDEIGMILGDHTQYDKDLLREYAGRLCDAYETMASGLEKAGKDGSARRSTAEKLRLIAENARN